MISDKRPDEMSAEEVVRKVWRLSDRTVDEAIALLTAWRGDRERVDGLHEMLTATDACALISQYWNEVEAKRAGVVLNNYADRRGRIGYLRGIADSAAIVRSDVANSRAEELLGQLADMADRLPPDIAGIFADFTTAWADDSAETASKIETLAALTRKDGANG